MVYHKKHKSMTSQQGVRFKKSLLAMCVMAMSAPSFAQDAATEDENVEEIVVTGMRQALSNAQDIKRNAATVVDSITAKDLGSFPDKSVAEALQRVAGITVNRFAASSDTAHFSAEPSGVIVRGLNQVRTEFNGRDSFSANSSRGLSWGDVSPELMSGVDTYKNQMAELIEGGIAGSVNMRTRVPFDQAGELIALTLNTNYGDLSKKWTPEASGIYSNRWDTSAGEMGFMLNLAYSEVQTRSEGNQLYRMNRFSDVYGADTLRYIPAAVNFRDNLYDRERTGAALAFQFQNPDESFVFTTQYNRSEYVNSWEEYLVQVSPADLAFGQSVFYESGPHTGEARDNTRPQPAPGTSDFIFDDTGLFQQGTFVTGTGWWGGNDAEAATFARNAAGDPFVIPCYNNGNNGWDGNGCSPSVRGIDTSTTTRSNNNENMTQDVSFNVKWSPTDTVRAVFDLQYVDSTVTNYDIEMSYWTFSNAQVDMTGDRPAVNMLAPSNVNMSPGMWSNPNNYYIRSIMDHVEDSEGDQVAFKTDWEFDFDNGLVESLKVGARWAKRDQTVRWTGYNWQNVANAWTGNQAHYFNLDRHEAAPEGVANQPGFTGYPEGHYVVREFGSDFFDLNAGEFVFGNIDLLQNQQLMASSMGATGLGLTGGTGWDPACSNVGDRQGEVAGTCFTPAEVADVGEETFALYAQLNFGGDDAQLFGVPVSGNLGLRFVRTENESTGGIVYPRLGNEFFFTWEEELNEETGLPEIVRTPDPTRTNLGCAPVLAAEPGQTPAIPWTVGCYLSAADVAFMNGTNASDVAEATHDHYLPSFNIKFDLNDQLVARWAISRAMSRPDIGNLRNYLSVSGGLPSGNDPTDPRWAKNSSGEITGVNVDYGGGSQNPYLKPVVADQTDITLEYYFADVGSVTFAAFYKRFDDYIQFGTYFRDVTNNGVTRTAEVRGPLNGEGASIRGFELAYQQYFDFLPAPWDGFGVQANYTFIDNNGISNPGVQNTGGEGTTVTGQAPDTISTDRLEGLSDHAANLVLMFEKGSWQARMAYSWRSEYMVTAIDCCVAYPIWNDDYGSLDGSIKYSINDNIDIRVQASNILNTETRLFQQVTNVEDGGLQLPNAWFQNDRRLTVGLSIKY